MRKNTSKKVELFLSEIVLKTGYVTKKLNSKNVRKIHFTVNLVRRISKITLKSEFSEYSRLWL